MVIDGGDGRWIACVWCGVMDCGVWCGVMDCGVCVEVCDYRFFLEEEEEEEEEEGAVNAEDEGEDQAEKQSFAECACCMVAYAHVSLAPAHEQATWRGVVRMLARSPRGLHPALRARIWARGARAEYEGVLRASDGTPSTPRGSKRVPYSALVHDVNDAKMARFKSDIEKDLHRTSSHVFFSTDAGKDVLARVLLAYSQWNPTVGYCQSLNFIGAQLILAMDKVGFPRERPCCTRFVVPACSPCLPRLPAKCALPPHCVARSLIRCVLIPFVAVPQNEEEAFLVLSAIVNTLPNNYFADLEGAAIDLMVFEELMRDRLPHLHYHLQWLATQDEVMPLSSSPSASSPFAESAEPPLIHAFIVQWFPTLFANLLPKVGALPAESAWRLESYVVSST